MPFDGVPNQHPVLSLPRMIADFETYSELDVREVGANAYAEHPSTEILCLSYGYPGQKKQIWYPGMPVPDVLIKHIEQNFPIEAHNCGFERAIWIHKFAPLYGVPVPKRWIDTAASCAYRGLPLGLDQVGEVLDLDVKKDKRGKFLLQKLSRPRKPTKKDPSTRCTDFDLLEELYDYCIQDSDAEDSLGSTLGDLPPAEYACWVLDQRINMRGIKVDMEAVHAAIEIVDKVATKYEAELQSLTDGAVQTATQTAKLLEWIQNNGIKGMPNLQANTIDDMLKMDWVEGPVRRVLQIRQILSRASTAKLLKFRDCTNVYDMRIRGLLQWHGAGTGRWSGRLVQPQNFPRGSIKAKFYELLFEIIKTRDPELLELHFGDPMEAVASALRGMFIADEGKAFYVADFSAIEARVVMWVAGQMDALRAFEAYDRGEGPDIYCFMASKIYQRAISKDKDPDERQLGKITILGCGYQMSGAKLQMQAEQSYGVKISLETAEMLVKVFRETYENVPTLWRGLEDAAIRAVRMKGSSEYKSPTGVMIRFAYEKDKAGPWLTMRLPSGRKLWYFNPGLEMKTISYRDKETGETKTFDKMSLYYEGRDNKRGGAWGRVYTYGGMLTENAVQAIARDLMVAAMWRVEKAGYPVILSVHDELVAEREDDGRDHKEFEHLVAGPNPTWAAGCPVAAEGWKGKRYRK